MKRMKLILILITICSSLTAPPWKSLIIPDAEKLNPYEQIWKAVCKVESNNNPFALNAKEQAFGIGQIRLCRLTDFNAIYGTHYVLTDMYSPELSRLVFMHYATKIGITNRDKIIRDWNGSGKMTYIYLAKVKKHLI
jgi:hypothetical protein